MGQVYVLNIRATELARLLDQYQKSELPHISYDTWRTLKSLANKKDYTTILKLTSDDNILMIIDYSDEQLRPLVFESANLEYFMSFIQAKTQENNIPININNNYNKEIKNIMNIPAVNFDFGPVTNNVAFSPYGVAVRNGEDHWFTYDGTKIIDVTGFVFMASNMIYKIPVAVKDLRPGDMVLHKNKPMFVNSIDGESGAVSVIDILASESKSVLPVSNMFGFDFVTKITSFINFDAGEPSADNPFGNLVPFLMMQSMFSNNGNGNSASFFGVNDIINQMVMYSALMGDKTNPFANMFNFGKSEKEKEG